MRAHWRYTYLTHIKVDFCPKTYTKNFSFLTESEFKGFFKKSIISIVFRHAFSRVGNSVLPTF